MKNMRVALGKDMNMREFVKLNLTTLLQLERAEYLDTATEKDKGNGHYARTLASLMGNAVSINVPRTRTGGFAPLAIELLKHSEEQVRDFCLALYTKGMTTRDVEELMRSFFKNTISHTSVSKLAEEFHTMRTAWESSPLSPTYKVIYGDCIFITVRRGDSYSKEAVYILYGVTKDCTRELLALSLTPTESAAHWREVMGTLKARGVEETALVVADGLEGFPDVVHEHFPGARFQSCVVHKMRAVLKDIRPKDKKAVADALKEVFDNFSETATTKGAQKKLDAFLEQWTHVYPNLPRKFSGTLREYLFSYIAFPAEVRRMIYTTNSIENLNRIIRKGTKNKLSFENPERLLDYVFVIIKDFEARNWSRYPVSAFAKMEMPVIIMNDTDKQTH